LVSKGGKGKKTQDQREGKDIRGEGKREMRSKKGPLTLKKGLSKKGLSQRGKVRRGLMTRGKGGTLTKVSQPLRRQYEKVLTLRSRRAGRGNKVEGHETVFRRADAAFKLEGFDLKKKKNPRR